MFFCYRLKLEHTLIPFLFIIAALSAATATTEAVNTESGFEIIIFKEK